MRLENPFRLRSSSSQHEMHHTMRCAFTHGLLAQYRTLEMCPLCKERFAKIQEPLKLLKKENFMKTDKRLKDKRRGNTIMTARRSDE